MNRERAETHLRLMAEAEMRDAVSAVPVSRAPWAAESPNASFPTMVKVAQALTTVRALDVETAEDILADFTAAVGVRQGADPGALGLIRLRLAGGTPFARPAPMPGGPAVRIALEERSPDGAEPQARKTGLSRGEHLLNTIADQLLTVGTDVTQEFRAQGPYTSLATGLGEIVAALEAADVLSPLSPVPGRLATLCASLRVHGHGITAPPARDLPEPWLSVLAHYHRRKPEAAPTRSSYATIGLALPELDGIRLALGGLHNIEWGSVLDVLVGTVAAPLPLSVWVHDSGGRWHATRQVGSQPPRSASGGERRVRLQLVPPLTGSPPWIEVVAAGMSAEVRAQVTLGWRYAP
jgi:hypothetical protein